LFCSRARRIVGLLFNPERIEFAGGGNVPASASWRQEAIFALLQRRQLDLEDSRRDLFGIVFFRVLLCSLGGMEDATGPGAEFSSVSLHVQPQQLVLVDCRSFGTANNEFRVVANL